MKLASKIESIQAASLELELPTMLEEELLHHADRLAIQYCPEEQKIEIGLPCGARIRVRGSIVDNCHCSIWISGAGWDFIDCDDIADQVADSICHCDATAHAVRAAN